MYKIEWTNKAFRQFRKIRDRQLQQSLFEKITQLEHFSNCENVLKLKGRLGFRLRVQNWRIIFDKEDSLSIIKIQEVRKRNERTYN